MPKAINDYYASGSNDMITLRENRDGYSRYRLLPRVLIDVSKINTQTKILGSPVDSPICLAPSAMQQMAHPLGERATARAAARHNSLMTLSSLSTVSMEEVAASAPSGLRWYQLYVYKDRSVTMNLVKRAEKAGYKAIVVTVDTPILGRREPDIRNKFTLPPHLTLGNFQDLSTTLGDLPKDFDSSGSGLTQYMSSLMDQSLNWSDISTLKRSTKLKIVAKGIITVEDAILALRHGVDGIWISNHGARQLDTTPATIDVLGEIAKAVGNRAEIYIDGGIMRGTDVLKALALGAKAVFLGRPVLWGLAHSGEEGLYHLISLIREELVLAMKLAGCPELSSIKPSIIRHASQFPSKL